VRFWPLDATYSVVGGVPEVRIFGVDGEGRRVVLVDRRFRPYFYAKCDKCDASLAK